MNVPRWLKWIGYPSWFLLCLVGFLYLTFPTQVLKPAVVSALEDVLGKGKQGRYGTDPEVTIGKLDLHYLSGLRFERLGIRLGSKNPDPGMLLEFDEASVRLPLLSIFFGSPAVDFSGRLYEGTVDGAVEIADDKAKEARFFGELRSLADGKLNPLNSLRTVVLNVEGIKLDRAPPLMEALGLPVTGTVKLAADLDLGKDAAKEGKGRITLAGTGLYVGEGKLPIAGGFSVPFVDLGVLDAEIEIAEGKGTAKTFKLTGRDLTAEIEPALRLRQNVLASNLTGPGWFKLSDTFLKENGKFKAILFDFPGPQKTAKDDKDQFHFALRGSLQSPSAAFSKSGGKASNPRARGRATKK